jgi:transcriptional regulator with XRE-family HTH domain
MTDYQPPTALPRAVLERPDMQAAIKAHDFGTVFALARRYVGVSYAKIAAECGIKPERVGALARGNGSVKTFEKITQIADALRIPGTLLGLAPRLWEQLARTPDEDGEDTVRRREFFTRTAGAGLAAGLPDLARPRAGRRVGSGVPQRLRERAARLRRLDDILGGGDTYRVYLSEYQATKALIRDSTYTETTGRALLSVLAEQAQQAGWAAFDAGRTTEATALYQASRQAAADAADTALAGNALAFLAYQIIDDNRPTALKMAARAVTEAGCGAPSGVRALLQERLAWAHAVAGHADQSQQALEAAAAALDEIGDAAQPDWAAWVDHRELQIMTGRCWTELRRPLRAVPALTTALAYFDDAHARDKSLYLSWLAAAYLDAGEPDQAAATADRALDLAAEVASVRPRERISPVLDRLSEHRALPAVAGVLDKAQA